MSRIGLLIFFSLFFASCTVGRWTVADQEAIDTTAEPVTIQQKTAFLVEEHPTVEKPIIVFAPYTISSKEYSKRVKVERTIQKYRPRGWFMATALTGAAFSFLAANTDAVISSDSAPQKLAMNITGGVLAILSVVNLEPTGEAIQTGETRLMRKSGSEIVQDTTRSDLTDNASADVKVYFGGTEVFSRKDVEITDSRFEINLAALADDIGRHTGEDSEIDIEVSFEEAQTHARIPVRNFLSKYINITEPIAYLRNSPDLNENNVISEVGEGSQLEFLEESGSWYKVKYQEMNVFLQKNAGKIEWITTFDSVSAPLFEFDEVPFGEIDVENLVPVLKTPNSRDRGIIISNGQNNFIGTRQYLERDHRLFRHYLRTALQVNENRIQVFKNPHPADWAATLSSIEDMYGQGSLFVYISGFATVRNGEILLSSKNEDEEFIQTPLEVIFESLKQSRPERMYVFVDVDYQPETAQYESNTRTNGYRSVLQQTADVILQDAPNSIVVFSSMPSQSSSLYTGQSGENKRHSIFNYYLADALKKKNSEISDLIQHLQNNVDYTSRRLHDRPQEVRAFGNMSLNLAE